MVVVLVGGDNVDDVHIHVMGVSVDVDVDCMSNEPKEA